MTAFPRFALRLVIIDSDTPPRLSTENTRICEHAVDLSGKRSAANRFRLAQRSAYSRYVYVCVVSLVLQKLNAPPL